VNNLSRYTICIFILICSASVYATTLVKSKVIYFSESQSAIVTKLKNNQYQIKQVGCPGTRYFIKDKTILSIKGPVEQSFTAKDVTKGGFFGFQNHKPTVFKFKLVKVIANNEGPTYIISPLKKDTVISAGTFKNVHVVLSLLQNSKAIPSNNSDGYKFITIDEQGYKVIANEFSTN